MFLNGIIGPKNANRKMIPKSLAEPILTAILEDDSNKLSELISNLEDVNSAFHLYNKKLPDILSNNPTMLCICCFFGSIECFNLIRDLDGNIKEEDDFGRNCFHFATAGGSLDMMRILHQSNTDNVKDNASSNNNNNNNNNQSDDDSSSDDDAIFIGRSFFRRSILKTAFAEFEDNNIYNKRDARGLTPMHYGAMFGRLNAIKYIWTKGAQLDKIHDFQGNRPIHLACLYGHTHVVKFFVENGVKFESDKLSNKLQPIHYACIGGYIDTIEYLISLKADINLMANSKTPIFYAARYGSLGAVKLLVKHGATFKFKRRKNSPIVEAALGGHADVINYFLKHGCDPNVYTSTGETPLMAAISGNNPEVVKLLLKSGAKISFEPFNRKKSNSKKNDNEEVSSEDENDPKGNKRGQKARKERNEIKRKMALLDKEIAEINSFNMKDTTDLLIASSRKGNIEIFKLILQNIDVQKYIESDEEITNRKKKVNREKYKLLLEEKKQEEILRKKRLRTRFGKRRLFHLSDLSSSTDEDDSDEDIHYNDKKAKEEEEDNEEEEKDEDKKIYRELCSLGYYSYGNFDDTSLYSDPYCGKLYQLFSNAVDFKSLELLKILIENKLIPKDTNKFYIRMANEGCVDMINYMLDNDIPFNKNDLNLKKEIFNLGKIEILEKFRQKGLKLDIQNDVCFLSRIISTYDPELLTYVLDKIYTNEKPKIQTKIKPKKRRNYYSGSYFYDDYSYSYMNNTTMLDPINTVLSRALQFPLASNHSLMKRSLLAQNAALNFEKTISENEENLKKILNILLDRGFKFNPKGLMFTIPPCVSLKEINLLFNLMKEIEKREDSEPMNLEKLKLGNIIHLLEEYDISEYIEFIDFLFARNFSPIPKATEPRSSQMRSYEEVDSNFSSALRTILLKNKYSDRISSIRRLSRYGIITDSSDDDYFYDNDYAENSSNNNDDNENDENNKKEGISEAEKEKEKEEKILKTEVNLINYMLSHGTPILERSLRIIEKIGHKTNNIELVSMAFKNFVFLDQDYKFERRYPLFDNDEHKTPLELACKRGYYEIVVDLVNRGANVNESGFNDYSSPLMFAVLSKNEKLVQFLKSKNAKMPPKNPTCSQKLMKSKDRWLSSLRPNFYSQYRPSLVSIGRHRKKPEIAKHQTQAQTNTATATAANQPVLKDQNTATATIATAANNSNIGSANKNAAVGFGGPGLASSSAAGVNKQSGFNQPFFNNVQPCFGFQFQTGGLLGPAAFNGKTVLPNGMTMIGVGGSANAAVFNGGLMNNAQSMNQFNAASFNVQKQPLQQQQQQRIQQQISSSASLSQPNQAAPQPTLLMQNQTVAAPPSNLAQSGQIQSQKVAQFNTATAPINQHQGQMNQPIQAQNNAQLQAVSQAGAGGAVFSGNSMNQQFMQNGRNFNNFVGPFQPNLFAAAAAGGGAARGPSMIPVFPMGGNNFNQFMPNMISNANKAKK